MKKEKKLQVWLTKDLEQQLKEIAKKEGRNISDIVREALNIYFEEKHLKKTTKEYEKELIKDLFELLLKDKSYQYKLKEYLISDEDFIEKLINQPVFKNKLREFFKTWLEEIMKKVDMYSGYKKNINPQQVIRIIKGW